MLFSDQRRHTLAVPATSKDGDPSTVAFLIDYLCRNVMKDSRAELFVLDGHLYVCYEPLPSHPTTLFYLYSPLCTPPFSSPSRGPIRGPLVHSRSGIGRVAHY